MSHNTILPNHETIINFFNSCRLPLYFSKPVLQHIKEFIVASTAKGYRGKVVDIAEWSSCHRTSIGHFLSHGMWEESYIQRIVKKKSLQFVNKHSQQTQKPIFVIHDDTVCEKTMPSSQAENPIEETSFHHSHLKGKTVLGHQMQATMVKCGEYTLIHDIWRYDQEGHKGYALFDSWYTCPKLINTYAAKGYQVIGALKTNRILYPQGIRTSLKTFATYVAKNDVHLVTVNGSNYWVYRYEGALNDIENVVVLFCWPQNAFQKPKALHAFLCTDVSLDTQTILDYYSQRWPIEIFFRQTKGNLGLSSYQVRSIQAIERLWVLICFTHLFCTIGLNQPVLFGDGLRKVRKQVKADYIKWIYECGKNNIPLTDIFKHLKLA